MRRWGGRRRCRRRWSWARLGYGRPRRWRRGFRPGRILGGIGGGWRVWQWRWRRRRLLVRCGCARFWKQKREELKRWIMYIGIFFFFGPLLSKIFCFRQKWYSKKKHKVEKIVWVVHRVLSRGFWVGGCTDVLPYTQRESYRRFRYNIQRNLPKISHITKIQLIIVFFSSFCQPISFYNGGRGRGKGKFNIYKC